MHRASLHAQIWGMLGYSSQHNAGQGKHCDCDRRANHTCCRRLDSRSTKRSLFLAPPTPRPLGLTDALTEALLSSCTKARPICFVTSIMFWLPYKRPATLWKSIAHCA